jgi:hypothetical protein
MEHLRTASFHLADVFREMREIRREDRWDNLNHLRMDT